MNDTPTPETDAEALSLQIQDESCTPAYVGVEFARKLERERDEARAEAEALRNSFMPDRLHHTHKLPWE